MIVYEYQKSPWSDRISFLWLAEIKYASFMRVDVPPAARQCQKKGVNRWSVVDVKKSLRFSSYV